MQAEVKQLCAAGERDEAQSKAMAYAKEMSTSEEMKAMQKCAEIARAMQKQMPAMAAAEIPAQFDPTENGHICDNLGE